jgi:PKD repeat protein
MFQQDIINNPQYEKNLSDLEGFTKQFINQSNVQRNSGQVFVIPVVFHILHQYGPENITDAQVIDQINILNRDFRKLNADTIDIVPAFKSIAADCEIEFRLATIDPNGNCTNGIDRIVTNKTYLADNDSKLNQWPNNKYLNIWTAHDLLNTGAAAYAQYPGGPASTDGIMTLSHYVGSIGSSNGNRSRVLTHEVGHCLNLAHVWGSTNSPGVACGDDNVGDTPETEGWSNCNLNASVCNPPVIENVQNYMEYTYCYNMFTLGQKARMHAALNSALSGRNNLWTNTNRIATGTDDSPVTICTPNADLIADYIYVCAGDPVIFNDLSWNAPITGHNWSFPGGVPSTSTDSAPVVVYPAGGVYNVTLISSSTGGSDTLTKVAYIHVTDTAKRSMPFTEDFENSNSFPGIDGWVENPDNAVNGTWSRVSNANTTPGGNHSIKMSNFINSAGEVDSWVSPSIDFSNTSFPVTISFNVAYAKRNSSSEDELKLFYSTNCGKSWQNTPYSKSGSTLSTTGINPNNFTPTQPSQWRTEMVNVNPVQNKPNVRFKFQNTSDRGNNIFIDDINITGTIIGIDETNELQTGFALYPNPSYGETTVSFGLNNSRYVTVTVKNVLGQEIQRGEEKFLSAGNHEYKLTGLKPGIYFVVVIVNNKHHIRKLVIS